MVIRKRETLISSSLVWTKIPCGPGAKTAILGPSANWWLRKLWQSQREVPKSRNTETNRNWKGHHYKKRSCFYSQVLQVQQGPFIRFYVNFNVFTVTVVPPFLQKLVWVGFFPCNQNLNSTSHHIRNVILLFINPFLPTKSKPI